MSSASVVVEKSSATTVSTSSSSSELNELYYQAQSPSAASLSPSSATSSTDSSPNSNSSTSSSSVTSGGIHLPARTSVSSVDSSLIRHKVNASNSDPSSTNHYRQQSCSSSSSSSSIKLPYPVLSDHRDLSSILIVLQKETHTTSKKIADLTEQIDDRERRLTSNLIPMHIKNQFKSERIKFKQKLDGLKKHERRVNLQIDFVTTKTEIKGLEDEEEQQQQQTTATGDEREQIKILLGKLRQKLDKMKVYMRTRNEQMKKVNNGKQQQSTFTSSNGTRKTSASSQKQRPSSSSAGKDLNRKRPPPSGMSHANKRLKSTGTPPIVRLTSRITSHTSKSSHSTSMPPPTVRFINKTTDSSFGPINSSSPTTPASSSSTLSPPLIASTSTGEASMKNLPQQTGVPLDDDDDDDDEGELNVDLDVDELFKEDNDSGSQETIPRTNSHHI